MLRKHPHTRWMAGYTSRLMLTIEHFITEKQKKTKRCLIWIALLEIRFESKMYDLLYLILDLTQNYFRPGTFPNSRPMQVHKPCRASEQKNGQNLYTSLFQAKTALKPYPFAPYISPTPAGPPGWHFYKVYRNCSSCELPIAMTSYFISQSSVVKLTYNIFYLFSPLPVFYMYTACCIRLLQVFHSFSTICSF